MRNTSVSTGGHLWLAFLLSLPSWSARYWIKDILCKWPTPAGAILLHSKTENVILSLSKSKANMTADPVNARCRSAELESDSLSQERLYGTSLIMILEARSKTERIFSIQDRLQIKKINFECEPSLCRLGSAHSPPAGSGRPRPPPMVSLWSDVVQREGAFGWWEGAREMYSVELRQDGTSK